MRKNILFTLLLISSGINNLSAQITITDTDVVSVGDTIRIARDTIPSGINVGSASSQSQTWDFTGLQMDEFDINAILNPASTGASAEFPNSNLAIEVNGGTVINYASKSASELKIDGFFGDPINAGAPVAIVFDPSSTLIKFPAMLGSTFNDTTKFNFYFSDPQLVGFGIDSIRISHTSYATRTVDAFGLLVTPADTFDCIRQYSMEILIDTLFMLPSGGSWMLVPPSFIPPEMGIDSNPNIDTTYTYNWYANGEGMAVATVQVDTVGGNVTSASFKITDKVVAGLFSVVNVACNANCEGSATVTAVSGYPPYTYLWDSAAGSQTDPMADTLCAGTYTVTITDYVGNTSSASVTVAEPAALTDSLVVMDAQCNTCADGSAAANISGGTSPYSYYWSTGQTYATITVAPGTYYITVTDASGCTMTDSAVVGFWPTAIDEIFSFQSNHRLYPNPNAGRLFIESKNSEVKNITIYSVLGEIVYQLPGAGRTAVIELPVEEGIYFVNIETASGVEIKRIHVIK